jgi:hypothetical protein
MESEVASAFAAFLGGTIGGAVGYFTHRLDWKERERARTEEFRRSSQQMLLSRRVDALQEAYSGLTRLQDVWNTEPRDAAELNRLRKEARQWWVGNVYYLHDGIPEKNDFLAAFNAIDASMFFRFQEECTKYLRWRAEQLGLDPVPKLN